MRKRSKPARPPQKMEVNSKTTKSCKTSSIFEFDNVKCEAILLDFLQKLSAELTASYQCTSQFFHPICLNYLTCTPQKSDAGSYEVLRLSRKIILANRSERVVLYILTSRCASRHNDVRFFNKSTCKSAPDLKCFSHSDFEMCFAPKSRVHFFDTSTSKSAQSMRCLYHFHFELCFRATDACNF